MALVQSDLEDRFELLNNATKDAIWDWDVEKNTLWCNEEAQTLLGKGANEKTENLDWLISMVHADDKARVKSSLHSLFKSGNSQWCESFLIQTPSGNFDQVLNRGFLQYQHGKPSRFLVTVTKIDDLLALANNTKPTLQQEPMESANANAYSNSRTNEPWESKDQKKFLTLIENSVDFIAMANVYGQISYTNKVGMDMLGIESEEEAVGYNVLDYHPDDEYPLIKEQILPSLLNNISFTGELYFKHLKTGERIPTYANCFIISDPQSSEPLEFAIVAQDLRKQKEFEKTVKESETLLDTITSATPTALWMSNEKGEITFVNQTWIQWTSLSFEENLGTGWTKAIIEEDRVRAGNKFIEDLQAQRYYEVDFRILNNEGEVRWCLANGRPRFNEDGLFVGYVGACVDITERKIAEQALKDSADRFMFMANAMPQMVWTANAQGEVNYFNQLWVDFTGTDSEETLGWEWKKIIHPDDVENTITKWKRSIIEGHGFEIEQRLLKKDGSYRWHLTRSTPQFDKEGKIISWIGTNTDIHDQKESEEFLILQARVLEIMDEGVTVTDERGYILYTNIAEDKIFGYDPGELISKPITILFDSSEDENNSRFAEVMARLDNNGYWNGEWTNLKKDGTLFTTYAHVTSLDIGSKKLYVYIKRDITVEKSTQEALDYQNKLIKTIADNATSTLFMMDKNGYCTFMNPAGEKMFGYTFEEIKQRPLHYMIHHHRPNGSFYPMEDCPIDRALPENFDIRAHEDLFFRKDGTSFPVSCAASPIFEHNVPVATVIEVRDITVRKQAEDALKRSAEILEKRVKERTRELVETNELLEKSNHDLEQFAYIASHDLQEPLRKIQIFADRLQSVASNKLPPHSTVWLLKILDAAQRMSTLIKDLLEYSRLTRKSLEQEFVPTDLNGVLANIQNDLELVIQQKQAVIIADPLPVIEAVELQMNQLFYNLISNSLKFSLPENKITVNIGVTILTEEEQKSLYLEDKLHYKIVFSDNGIGFNQDFANQIFVIFKRLNTQEKFPGTGIGLALCKKVVDNHHGIIYANGVEGEGASFTIILPAKHLGK